MGSAVRLFQRDREKGRRVEREKEKERERDVTGR